MTFTSVSPENGSQEPLKLNWISLIFFAIVHLSVLLTPWFFSWSALGVTILLH